MEDIERQLEASWVAGFVDGEGSIFPSLKEKPAARSGFDFCLYLMVGNTNLKLVEKVVKFFGFGKIRKDPRTANRKTMYRVVYPKGKLPILLPKIIPYLVGKKEQACIALEICAMSCGPGTRRTQEQWDRLVFLYNELRRMNKRGLGEYKPMFPTFLREEKTERTRKYQEFNGMKTCSIGGCKKRYSARGMCSYHYARWHEQKKQNKGQLRLVTNNDVIPVETRVA